MSELLNFSKKLKHFCDDHPNWFEDDLIFEDPTELARYGIHIGHMDESRLLNLMENEIIQYTTENFVPIDEEE